MSQQKLIEELLQAIDNAVDALKIAPGQLTGYNYDKFSDHKFGCPTWGRGDQGCRCGYSSVRTNLDTLIDECVSSRGESSVSVLEKAANKVRSELKVSEEPEIKQVCEVRVNYTKHYLLQDYITYEEVCRLANIKPEMCYTVVYASAERDGTMLPSGKQVRVTDGMRIYTSLTSNA